MSGRRFVFIVLLAILIGALAGQWILKDAGYILLSYRGIFVETTLWFGIASLLIFILIVFLIYRIAAGFLFFPWRVRNWRRKKGRVKAAAGLQLGLLNLAGGDAAKTYMDMRYSPWLENRLVAAAAALDAKQYEQAIRIVKNLPMSQIGQGKRAVLQRKVTRASAFITAQAYAGQHRYLDALSSLAPLLDDKKKTMPLLTLLREIYINTNQWKKFAELLPALREGRSRHQLIRDYQLYLNKENRPGDLESCWNKLTRDMQREPLLLSVYALSLMKTNTGKAEKLLATALTKKYEPLLVDAYKSVQSDRPLHQLNFIEMLLNKKREDKHLLAAAAALATRNQLMNKAKDYYEKLVEKYAVGPAETLAYAQLLQDSNNAMDKKKAQDLYCAVATAKSPQEESQKDLGA